MLSVTERLRRPRILGAILLLGLVGGLILAYLYARGDLVGADARAYWTGVRIWLAGGDPYAPAGAWPGGAFLPYAYPPWTLVLFLPWALLPWPVAWFSWQALNVALFAASVGWAYQRRPLATALLVALLAVPIAAHLDTGNVGLLLVLGIWLAHVSGPRIAGLAWAISAAMKLLPVVLIWLIPPPARRWGVAFLALAMLLTLATWPLTLRQLDVVFSLPRPLRFDYLIFAWAAVPWLWSQPWPPWWLDRAEMARRWRDRPRPADALSRFFGLSPTPAQAPGSSGTSTPADRPR